MLEKKATTEVPINDVMARRWSGRAYDPGRPVEPEKLLACMEAARWSLSCFGAQPWQYVVCDRARDQAAWDAALDCLVEGNRAWAQNAPVLILSVASENFKHNGQPNRWAQHDTGAASISLCLQATDLGLMAHQMGGFDAGKAREVFSVPEEHTPMAMIAIGYQLLQREMPEELHAKEFAPRHRNPVGDHFFSGKWNNSWMTESTGAENV